MKYYSFMEITSSNTFKLVIRTELYLMTSTEKKNLRGFGPLANYADRATAASWRSTNFCG
jgi:hypothetical protein